MAAFSVKQVMNSIQAGWQRISRIALSSQTADRAEAPTTHCRRSIMIACVSSPPDAAPVSNRHIDRSHALCMVIVYGFCGCRVSSRPQAESSLYADIQLSRCGGSSNLPLHYLWCFRGDFSPLFRIFLIFEQSAERGCNSICHKRITFFFPLRSREVIISYFSCREGGLWKSGGITRMSKCTAAACQAENRNFA